MSTTPRLITCVMPGGSVHFPSLGLSTLKAVLATSRVSMDIRYFNIDFAQAIGAIRQKWFIEQAPLGAQFVEWLFSGVAFGGPKSHDETYMREVILNKYGSFFGLDKAKEIPKLQSLARDFILYCLGAVDWAKYDVIGFSTMFQQNSPSIALARAVKSRYPDKNIIFGGANCDGEMGRTLHSTFTFIDFVFMGEAEVSLHQFAQMWPNLTEQPLRGVLSRHEDKTPTARHTGSERMVLDEIPCPDFSEFFEQREESLVVRSAFNAYLPYETSRGCWWGEKHHCTFCGQNGSSLLYRSKTPQRVEDDLRLLTAQYPYNVSMADNILDMNYFTNLIPRLASRPLDVEIFYETKVNLSEKHVRALVAAKINHIQPGIESLSSRILSLMNKGSNTLQSVRLLRLGKEFGLTVDWNMLYGTPGEDEADYVNIEKVITKIGHLRPPCWIGTINVDRFSPYFDRPSDFGIEEIKPFLSTSLIFPFSEDIVRGLSYHFEMKHRDALEELGHIARVLQLVQEWRERHSQTYLRSWWVDEQLVVEDGRTVPAQRFVLDDVKSQILREAADITTLRNLRDFGFRDDEISMAVDELLQDSLCLSEGNSLLGLVERISPNDARWRSPRQS